METRKNVKTSFMPKVREPQIGNGCNIDGIIIGAAVIGENVNIGETSVIRGDEGFDLFVGSNANLGKGVIIHGLETEEHGAKVEKNIVKINSKEYSVYVGENCILHDGVQVHGPALVMDNVTMMRDSFVFKGTIMDGCIVGQGAKIIGVTIPKGKYVPAGVTIKTEIQVEELEAVERSNPQDFPRQDYLKNTDLTKTVNIDKGEKTYVDSEAILSGGIKLGSKVYIAPYSYVISDKTHVTVGSDSNVQDGAILCDSIIGKRVSMAHQSKVFRTVVEDSSFIGMQSIVIESQIGNSCVVEPGCVIEGVEIIAGRYVPAGSYIDTQEQADQLPVITDDYELKNLNSGVVHVNEQLAEGYSE